MKKAKKRVSITLDAEAVEKLRILAKSDDRTLSQYINRLLKLHVAEKKEKDGSTDILL